MHPGDFFTDALPAGDYYLIMQVIHDWSDEKPLASSQRYVKRRGLEQSC